MQEQVEKF